jgi:hypothetical protein
MTAQAIDDVLADTFPASDPPAWTSGIARPAPDVHTQLVERTSALDDTLNVRGDVIDVSPPDLERTVAQALGSLIGAAGLALLVPFAILAVGTPVALAVHGVLEVAERLVAFVG